MMQTAGAVTDSEKSLNYHYDDEAPLQAAAPRVAMTVLEGAPVHERPAPGATATVSSARSLSLGNRSVAVDMKLPEAAQTQLPSFTMSAVPRSADEITGAWLVLENVEIGPDGQDGGFRFNIIATLPDSSRRVKLGQLGTFTWPLL
jgi:hypothetical protein